jgi:hypothetical protein
MLLTVKYSCDKCGIVKRDVIVCERQSRESIKDFVSYVGQQCGDDHHRRSPHCEITKLTSLMIPVHEKKGIGFQPETKAPETKAPA